MYYLPPPQQADGYHDMLNRPQSQSANTYFSKRTNELSSLQSRNNSQFPSKYAAYSQAVSRNIHHSNEKLAYFPTEDGHNLVSVQTKSSRHTPDKKMGEPKNSKSISNIRKRQY